MSATDHDALTINPVGDIWEVSRSLFGQAHADRWLKLWSKFRGEDDGWGDIGAAFFVWLAGLNEDDKDAADNARVATLVYGRAVIGGAILPIDPADAAGGRLDSVSFVASDQLRRAFCEPAVAASIDHLVIWDNSDGRSAAEFFLSDDTGSMLLSYGDAPAQSLMETSRRLSGEFFRAVHRRIAADAASPLEPDLHAVSAAVERIAREAS